MLQEFIQNYPTPHLVTYTRNPAVLKMLRRVSHDVYPLDADGALRDLAQAMPYATPDKEAVYHLNRYSQAGLFQGDDPANGTIDHMPLKQRFTELQNVRHALVVAARLSMELEL